MNTNKRNTYKTCIDARKNKCGEGESLEQKIRKLLTSNAPIEAISPIIYTERKDGVHPEHDIRTDRYELAIEAGDRIHASLFAAREETMKKATEQPKTE